MELPPMNSEAFLDLPALTPPEGVIPNFVNPPSLRAPGWAGLQLSLATIAVIMRLYTKRFIVRSMLAEDWWLLVAWVCFICFQVNIFLLENLPLGVHQWDMTMRTLIKNAKIFHISTAIYCIVALPLKVSIILQIRRIVLTRTRSELQGPYRRGILRWVIDFFIAMNVIFYVFIVVFQLLTCQPLRKAWDFRLPGHCVPHRLIIHICSASINATSDLFTIILPQPVIWSLKMDRRKKWGLSAVFLLGGLACGASAVRLYYTVLLYSAVDQTYAVGIMVKWAEPELTLGFLATCLPVLPALIKHISRKRNGYSSRTGGSGAVVSGDGSANKSITEGRITKKVEMDIEFAQLTALEEGDHRSDSLHSLTASNDADKSHLKQYGVLSSRPSGEVRSDR